MPNEGLFPDDVGVAVERHDLAGYETGYGIEFFDLLGNPVSIATLPASALRAPTHADRTAGRSEMWRLEAIPRLPGEVRLGHNRLKMALRRFEPKSDFTQNAHFTICIDIAH